MARHARVAVDEMKELANEWRDLQRSTSVKTTSVFSFNIFHQTATVDQVAHLICDNPFP
jgi:hypothetical protein